MAGKSISYDAFIIDNPNAETDIIVAEMARECFENGYFGKTVERFGFLYADEEGSSLSMHKSSDEAYLARVECELRGVSTSAVTSAKVYMEDAAADETEAEAALGQQIREALKEFDATYFARAQVLPRQKLLTRTDLMTVKRAAQPPAEGEISAALSCGVVIERADGTFKIIENGCMTDFILAVEAEMARGGRVVQKTITRLSLSNRSVVQAHRAAKEQLQAEADALQKAKRQNDPQGKSVPAGVGAARRLMCYVVDGISLL